MLRSSRKTLYDCVLRGAHLVLDSSVKRLDIAITGERIAAVGNIPAASGGKEINLRGLHILPGIIDSHVHFRESGFDAGVKDGNGGGKPAATADNIASASRAALIGGVTAFCDMPNTSPATVDGPALKRKLMTAKSKSFIDYAFWIGVTADNIQDLNQLCQQDGAAGGKLFMGSSTGQLLLEDDQRIAEVLRSFRGLLAVHAEDEYRLNARRGLRVAGDVHSHQRWRDVRAASLAVQRLLRLMQETSSKAHLHILHMSSAAEVKLLQSSDLFKARQVSAEACLHHLTWSSPEVFKRFGSLAQVNPPIRGKAQRLELWRALRQGFFTTIGSDHAPHFSDKKALDYPASPSGSPGVGALLPVMLDHVAQARLSLTDVARLLSSAPARLLGMRDRGEIKVGAIANLSIVDTKKRHRLTDAHVGGLSASSPYAGMKVTGAVKRVYLHGNLAMCEGEVCEADTNKGEAKQKSFAKEILFSRKAYSKK